MNLLSRTCDAPAEHEVHGLHAHGKVHLPDIPCEKGRMEGRKKMDKMRNEEACAAGLKTY
jgi:hypothetical protein